MVKFLKGDRDWGLGFREREKEVDRGLEIQGERYREIEGQVFRESVIGGQGFIQIDRKRDLG